jgi:hypothetical protein
MKAPNDGLWISMIEKMLVMAIIGGLMNKEWYLAHTGDLLLIVDMMCDMLML